MRRTSAFAVALLSLLLASCGAEEPTIQPDGAEPPHDGGAMSHIHGLGVEPATDALYVATHAGLFKAAEGERQPQRVGNSEQDIMGFSVAGRDRFLGSGHPAAADTGSPPHLGLIESRDGGRTWTNVSLLGEADFHVLESSGNRVYGFDATRGRLMVSDDGGNQWTQRRAPAAVFDLAIDPRDPDRLVASTERGVVASSSGGRAWRMLRDDTAGLLAWPAPARLFLVDGRGEVARSSDAGRSWRPVGDIGGRPTAFVADDSDVYVALADNTVKRSTDGGATWSLRAAP